MNEFDKKWVLDNDSLNLIKLIIKIKQPKNILDIGTFKGHSTLEISKETNAQIVSIEKDDVFFKEAETRLKDIKNIKLIKGDACLIIPNLKTKFDLILIDGMHREYIEYLKLLEENALLEKDAIIIADNVISHKEKVQNYLEYVKINYNSKTINIGKGLEISIR